MPSSPDICWHLHITAICWCDYINSHKLEYLRITHFLWNRLELSSQYPVLSDYSVSYLKSSLWRIIMERFWLIRFISQEVNREQASHPPMLFTSVKPPHGFTQAILFSLFFLLNRGHRESKHGNGNRNKVQKPAGVRASSFHTLIAGVLFIYL